MKVRDVIERIRFSSSTINDLTGKSANNLFSNKNIVQQLKYSLDKYASKTFALDAIYTVPITTDDKYIDAPSDILRSQTYKLALMYIQGRIFNLKITSDVGLINTDFPYEITGPPRFVLAWADKLYFYPGLSNSYYTTSLSKGITEEDTEIDCIDTSTLPLRNGYISIDDEVIKYMYTENNILYNCERGLQNTSPSAHISGSQVSENNLHLFYYKKHFEIPIYANDKIAPDILNREMEICDEHIEIICDYTAYKLLSKNDISRAEFYKVNFDEWIQEAAYEIRRGREQETQGQNIPTPFLWETDSYLGYAL